MKNSRRIFCATALMAGVAMMANRAPAAWGAPPAATSHVHGAAAPPTADSPGPEVHRLLGLLDLGRPDLVGVKAAVVAGDEALAMRRLTEHFRARFPRSAIHPRIINNVRRDADEALNMRFRSRSSPDYFQVHKDFDWKHNPVGPKDHHWISLLVSMHPLEFLADVYIRTGDEKYARGCVRVFNDWLDECPPGSGSPSWSLATTMIRAGVLINVFQRLVQWPRWSIEDEARMLCDIADHGQFMVDRRGPGNQDATNSEHLMRLAAAFPEFKQAPRWNEQGFARIRGRIFTDTLADGCSKELCSGYHVDAVNTYTVAYDRLRDMGQAVSPDYAHRLEKMYGFCLAMVRPDGGIPTNGDSDAGGILDVLRRGADLFHRPDMLYVATRGKAGSPPASLDMALPVGGYYTFRTGWTRPDDLYLFIDASTQPVVSHQDYDALHIDLYAFGRDFFPDAGTFSYGGEAHRQAKATRNHTTVTLDDQNQGNVPCVPHAFAHSTLMSFFDASQAGYPGVTHTRQLLFIRPATGVAPYVLVIDRLTGTGRHTVDLYFHLPPGPLDVDPRACSAVTRFPTGANLRILELDPHSINASAVQTDMHPHQGINVPRPGVRFRRVTGMPATFVTLLLPYGGATPPTVIARLLNSDAAAVTIEVDQPGIKDTLTADANAHATLTRTTAAGEQRVALP